MKIEQMSKINPICRFVVWMVNYGTGSTSNPMSKRKAIKLFEECQANNPKWYKNASLIRSWSCVRAKNFK